MPIPAGPASTSTTSLNAWIAETRDHLEGSRSEEANQLGAAYTAGSGTVTFTHATGNIGPGTLISIGTNTLRVLTVNTLTKTATVIAGQNGSTDANGAINDLVRVTPRFTDHQIVREINRHLASLSSPRNGLYGVYTTELAYTASVESYDLNATGLVRVLEVRRQTFGSSYAWPRVPPGMWELDRAADTTDFPSGISLRVREGNTGLGIQVVYGKTFDPISTTGTTLVATTGIAREQEDIPPLGAAVRLMSGREVSRSSPNSQGDSRRSNEVPPGAVGASYRGLVGLWQERVKEESARLRAMYPYGR